MAKKKNSSDEERTPDLKNADNQAELEARVAEMMELEPPKSKKKTEASSDNKKPNEKKKVSITIVDHNEEAGATPDLEEDPELLAAIEEANSKLKASEDSPDNEAIDGAEDLVAEETPAASDEEPEEDPEVVAEKAETDKTETAPELDEDQLEADKEIDPEEETLTEQSDDVQPKDEVTAPELPDEWDAVLFDDIEEEDTSDDDEDDEDPSEKDTKEVEEDTKTKTSKPKETDSKTDSKKEKPLKHLDSIVPKSKVASSIEQPDTDAMVKDIVTHESDALLQAEDEKRGVSTVAVPKPAKRKRRHISSAIKSRLLRIGLVLLVVATLAATLILPGVRYAVLNAAGVRSASSLRVLDQSTQQPLRGVRVAIGSQTAETDSNGAVSFEGLRLGPTNLSVEKRAYEAVHRPITIGWGSNPLNDVSINPTGTQYRFVVNDYHSGKPLPGVEAASNDAFAKSNDTGEIALAIEQINDEPRQVSFSLDGYRTETVDLNLDQSEAQVITMVPAQPHMFISSRDGSFDVYKVDIDGQNETLLLPGTGSERDDMVLLQHQIDDLAALVSTRDNKRNDSGELLSTLTVINAADQTHQSVVTSERVQVLDWIGSRLIYVALKEGATQEDPERHALISYDHNSKEFTTLATANYFNDVIVAGGHVYFAPARAYIETEPYLYRVEADGSQKTTVLNRETWNVFRANFETLYIAASNQEWYQLTLGQDNAGKIGGEPPSQQSHQYAISPNGEDALWADFRDGKGTLLLHTDAAEEDEVLRTQAGLQMPLRWVNDSVVVYRIVTETESADYALSLSGGEPKKITDVTDTSATESWYFY